MTPDGTAKIVLPVGVVDVLPPYAAFEAAIVERLTAAVAAWGYERVAPPLIEFEAGLLAGSGATLAAQTFRLMDPVSQNMLALRPDMTMQVARIAADRLGAKPRPLRLGYAGQVVRVRGSQLRPARQFRQVGAELIGADGAAADAEVIVMACQALTDLGVRDITVDLGIPTMVPALLAAHGSLPAGDPRLRLALDRKDPAAVAALAPELGADAARLLAALVVLAGPARGALAALARLDLPEAAAAARTALEDVVARIERDAPELALGVDPVERRGFEYHTGVTFALFVPGVAGDVGRGGRYRAGDPGEPATGITLFVDAVLQALPEPAATERIFLPWGTPPSAARPLRASGRVVVAALSASDDVDREARRLGCGAVLVDGQVRAVRI
jgi:ATP phosphoribosyltransferase regulatory subunit